MANDSSGRTHGGDKVHGKISDKAHMKATMDSKSKSVLRETESPVRQAVVVICEKCGKKIAKTDNPDENPSRVLQKSLKSEFKDMFGRGEVRPVVSTCLDICPDGEIAVAVFRVDDKASARFYTFSSEDAGDVSDSLLKVLRKP